MGILNGLGPILMVVLGLGFVIFIHELGHFALAKWAGVKVEKFSIGFGPTLVGFRRGETQYSISAIPLGGFVKMLGENPSEDGEQATTDPRSYLNKTVGQRMAIISAGVIMNIITAVGFFALAYRLGISFTPAIVGMVVPGTPAYEAGIRQGDEIVSIDGQDAPSFEDLLRKVSTSSSGQIVKMGMKRAENSEPYEVQLSPSLRPGKLKPEVGLATAGDLQLGTPQFGSVPGLSGSKPTGDARAGDRIVAVAPVEGEWVEVDSEHRLMLEMSRLRSQPIRLKLVASEGTDTAPREIVVPPVPRFGLGIRFKIGPVASIQDASPAKQAGIVVGDRLIEVEGQPIDPRTLPGIALDAAGKSLKLKVEDASGEQREVVITPRQEVIDRGLMFTTELQDVPPLGLSFFVEPLVAAVDPGGAAEKAGIRAGQTLTRVKFVMPESEAKTSGNPVRQGLLWVWGKIVRAINPEYEEADPNLFLVESDPGEADQSETDDQFTSVNALISTLNFVPVTSLTLNFATVEQSIDLVPQAEPGVFLVDRGIIRQGLVRPLPPQSFGVAVSRGFADAKRGVGEIYRTLRALVTMRVSRKLLGGPVTIAQVAHASATEGLGQLMNFLGMLSINLAVLNFLPIAPLDGGQMVMLMGEKIRGKPLPERLQVAFTLVGLSFVLGLMFMVLSQDILRVFGFM